MPSEGQGLCALAEQRGQRAEVRLNRVCSALTRVQKAFVGEKPSKVKMLQAVGSGQLRFLGSWARSLRLTSRRCEKLSPTSSGEPLGRA